MLSRVADSIYWMNRYMERAENVARFVDVNLNLMLDLPNREAAQWDALVATTGDHDYFRAHYGVATKEAVLHFLTADAEYPNSILSCLTAARENARSVREAISSEMWEQGNRSYLHVRDAAQHGTVKASPHEFFSAVKLACHLFTGITHVTMSHNEAWHFGRLARLLERADKTSRIVDVKYFLLLPDPSYVGSAYDEIQWAALLKSASAFEMYRKRYGRISPSSVIEFLILDDEFPRSVRFCVRKAERSIAAIVGISELQALEDLKAGGGTRSTNAALKLLGALRAQIDRDAIGPIVESGVHQYLDSVQTRLNDVGQAVHDTFFVHAKTVPPPRWSEPPPPPLATQ
ncbi:MAG: alpha-E domain-containing protein [Polyangiales bacterium]